MSDGTHDHTPEYWDHKIEKAFDKAFPADPPPAG